MPFEMRKNKHIIVVGKVLSDPVFLKMYTALYGDLHVSVLVHNIYICDSRKTVFFGNLPVHCCIGSF